MSISVEAVEAAAKASFQFMEDRPWTAIDPDEVDFFKDAARKALEAAAPHMLAELRAHFWDDGYRACSGGAHESENPYRGTK